MFFHNFKYSLKTLFRNKAMIFWTFAFPIILGTFFYLAFSDIENSEKLDIIDVAIIKNEEFESNELYKAVFKELSDKDNKDRLFNIKYIDKDDEKEAKELLDNEKISGYLEFVNGKPKLTFKSNGINETIFKYVTEGIVQSAYMGRNVSETKANLKDISRKNLSYTMIEFYTLIAMTCLYGGLLGAIAINQNLANMTCQGKRIATAPVKKWQVIISSALSCYITQILGVALLFISTIFALKIDYGNHFFKVVLLSLVGCLAGLSLGIFVATLVKAGENAKTGIIISITMAGCFLSGMMGISMKYIVDKNAPIVNKLNPASMITDGFYALYYYDTFDRYYFDLISLLIFAFILIGISCIGLRRQKYDSI